MKRNNCSYCILQWVCPDGIEWGCGKICSTLFAVCSFRDVVTHSVNCRERARWRAHIIHFSENLFIWISCVTSLNMMTLIPTNDTPVTVTYIGLIRLKIESTALP